VCSELATAGSNSVLATIISKNVDKAIRLYNMKCDEMVTSGREAVQVSGPPNHAQMKNIAVANTLYLFYTIVNQVRISTCTCVYRFRSLFPHGPI